jgi:hypothetical protein
MAACVRIYTVMGKENCVTVDSFSLNTWELSKNDNLEYSIVFTDSNEDVVTQIDRIVEAGQPCNMHIRYKDDQVEAVCTLNGCKLINDKIVCDKPDMKIIGWTG